MLELLLVYYLANKIGKIAEQRGHSKRPNVIFFVVMWFAGEFIGAMTGLLVFKGRILPAYVMALIGAAIGTVIAFNIVQDLEDNSGDDDTITINID